MENENLCLFYDGEICHFSEDYKYEDILAQLGKRYGKKRIELEAWAEKQANRIESAIILYSYIDWAMQDYALPVLTPKQKKSIVKCSFERELLIEVGIPENAFGLLVNTAIFNIYKEHNLTNDMELSSLLYPFGINKEVQAVLRKLPLGTKRFVSKA